MKLFIYFILFVSISKVIYANDNIKTIFNNNLNRFLVCTSGKVELIKSYDNEKNYIFIFENLNLDCLKNKNLEISQNEIKLDKSKKSYFSKMLNENSFENSFQIIKMKSVNNNFFYEKISIKNPFIHFMRCGDNCSYGNENIIKINNKFFYMHHGISGFNNIAEVQNNNIIKFSINLSTHKRNFFFQIDNKFFGTLVSGDVKIFDKYYEVYNKKGYFKKTGSGTFGYASRRSYENIIIKLLPTGSFGPCYGPEYFHDHIKSVMIESKLDEYCVKSYN